MDVQDTPQAGEQGPQDQGGSPQEESPEATEAPAEERLAGVTDIPPEGYVGLSTFSTPELMYLHLIMENTRRQAEAFEAIQADFAKITEALGTKLDNSPAARFAIRKLIGG